MTARTLPVRRRALSALACAVIVCTATPASDYQALRSRAVADCEAIDAAAYQTGLIFNPAGYRSYYVRSECFQRIAVQFRDASLCAQVRRRSSLFFSSWGYSEKQCRKEVAAGLAADEETVAGMRQRHRQGAIRMHDFRVERNGNGRDFDIVPSFTGDHAGGYLLRFEILPEASGEPVLVHSNGYHLDGRNQIRIFLRQDEIRDRFAGFAVGETYTVRATVILDIGRGGQAGWWSEEFIDRTFPERERSRSLERQVRFP